MNWVIDRLKEPSTYAGLAVLLSAIGHADLEQPIQAIGMGLAGLLAIVLPEVAKHKAA